MAKALFVEKGYGQVEPNRLTGITFGNIEAQAPAYYYDSDNTTWKVIPELQNGMFLAVVPAPAGVSTPLGRAAVLPGDGVATSTLYLVFSEKKLYDERDRYCDFVMEAKDKVDGTLYPRLIGLTPGSCVFTTNTINIANNASISVNDIFYVGDDGFLTNVKANAKNTTICFRVVKDYTMPDGQRGIKFEAANYA